jgi:cytochrome c oxidase subunit 2
MTTWNGIFFQNPSSFIMELVSVIHDYVSIFLVSILILVFINLAYSFILKRFNLEFYENHQLERIWTLVPFFLLIFIVIPSLTSLYILDSCLFCGITISIIGHQWYWRYFYKDLKDYFFDSYIIPSSERVVRLLDVDNRLIIPTFLPVRFLVSSSDVIHSWTIPSFGLKIDAVPGRINQFCFSSKRRGVYFGQCSEICGANHRFMPIVLESVPFRKFISFF